MIVTECASRQRPGAGLMPRDARNRVVGELIGGAGRGCAARGRDRDVDRAELPAGEVAVIEVSELTVNDVAAVDPNLTAVAPVKPVPVIVTEVPPASGPAVGLMLVTVGVG